MSRKIDLSEGLANLTEDELNYLRDRNQITQEAFDEAMSEEVDEEEEEEPEPPKVATKAVAKKAAAKK